VGSHPPSLQAAATPIRSSSFCMTRRVFPGCFGSVSVIWRKGNGSHAKTRRVLNGGTQRKPPSSPLLRVRFLIP
jgi:hypothetical protein